MSTLTATACMFKRSEKSAWEAGVAVTDKGSGIGDIDVIVDKKGKAVPAPIWNYKLLPDSGDFTFDVDLIEGSTKKGKVA